MGDGSKIGWTNATWNPTTGCDRVSDGCTHCYALTLAARMKARGFARYQRDGDPRTSGPGFGLTLHADALDLPLRWTKPRLVFVNSMSDLFHSEVPGWFIAKVFAVMAAAPQHRFQVLTKRPRRMQWLLNDQPLRGQVFRGFVEVEARGLGVEVKTWPLPNVWLGTSAEDQVWADRRIPLLLDSLAAVRFVSAEPLLGPIDLRRYLLRLPSRPALDWVIVGGESGPSHRPMAVDWVQAVADACEGQAVPLFVKQGSGRYPGKQGDLPDELWARQDLPFTGASA